jgi:hypothetical protein
MTLDDLLSRLDNVTPRGSRYMATCKAHPDRSPSLQVTPGDKGVLLKCWAGCSLIDICKSLGIEQRDLFLDALDANPSRRRAAAQQRDRQRKQREQHADQQGTLIDALREADYFVQSRRGIDISTWIHERLNDELNSLADADRLLESEALYG